MTIETKFNKGEKAWIIEDNTIMQLEVADILFEKGVVSYSFIKYKRATSLDKDIYTLKSEKNCYKDLEDLVSHFKIA